MSARTDSIEAECARRASAKTKVLNALMAAGPTGVLNTYLNVICYRYGARIHELREAGWAIERESAGPGVYRYTLRGRKEPTQQALWGAA